MPGPEITIAAMAHAPAGAQWRVETPTGASYHADREAAEQYAAEYRAFWAASLLAK